MDGGIRVRTVVCASSEHDPDWRWYKFDFHVIFGRQYTLIIILTTLTIGTGLLGGHILDVLCFCLCGEHDSTICSRSGFPVIHCPDVGQSKFLFPLPILEY